MKKFLILLSLTALFFSCNEDDGTNTDGEAIWIPILKSERENDDIILQVVDPRPFTLYDGFVPVDGDFIDLFTSTDGVNFEMYKTVDFVEAEYVIDDLQTDQQYYFKAEARKEGLETQTSNSIIIYVGELNAPEPVINISDEMTAARISPSGN
ncbi:MAG: hypothetical protein WBA74_24570, partial [Cyclobacteriaceae bacterium]